MIGDECFNSQHRICSSDLCQCNCHSWDVLAPELAEFIPEEE